MRPERIYVKHNLRSVLRLTEARTFWVRAVRAWRNLLPDWTPTLDELRKLESMPHEHRAAVAIVSHGWDANDARWDVLMALLEWERREATDAAYKARLVPASTSNITYFPEEMWDDFVGVDLGYEWDESEPVDTPAEEASDEPEAIVVDEPGDPLGRHLELADERRERVVVPWKLTTRMGQTLQSGETTVETPLKAAFLDRLQPVKHLREKDPHARDDL